MNYRFDLKSTQIYLLLGGMIAVGALLFVVGMLIGTSSTPSKAEPAGTESVETAAGDNGDEAVEASGGEPADTESPAPEASTPPLSFPASASNQERIYELQLSAHLDQEASQPVLEALASNNLQPYLVETTDSRNRTLFTVRLGPWDSMAEAAEAARAFRDHADLDAYDPVIRHRPKPLAPPSEDAGSG